MIYLLLMIEIVNDFVVVMIEIFGKQNAAYGCVRKYKKSAVSDGRRYE